ncbi:MAG: type II toxin-antitoxin system Phd/YefM family antitoxin [Rhodospirillaceae bacterium]|jgi:prevent-host-death family protein|nr:type II toxin-antitoxin system Phd/YefM family antitoxin [Rhodospirillaceae bacterium]MBT3887023.1 type II toxin-antitoxin system Phd/YefM family antitoxin [Rhodospirillaceae bacterium]MBT4115745.1 type II toxin-antitoxin system Phd/YefM family antitoxin [Rhodospirillaceae bacterium]MBT4673360.1 type II toxin-antitoxin system Phd/YefM family antitoxin [Rhodospirillaceae bacterium]MBT4719613.1 type II toxin-antitoxin system Phd/YefM family antitoxin [Rhodospirillaceae bacterium]
MQTMSASEFKAKCLNIMDEVAASGEPVTITKNGKPVAQLGPCKSKPKSLFGIDKDNIEIKGDIISPIDVEWEANQ